MCIVSRELELNLGNSLIFAVNSMISLVVPVSDSGSGDSNGSPSPPTSIPSHCDTPKAAQRGAHGLKPFGISAHTLSDTMAADSVPKATRSSKDSPVRPPFSSRPDNVHKLGGSERNTGDVWADTAAGRVEANSTVRRRVFQGPVE